MQILDRMQAEQVTALCELIVPGCARIGAACYVDALLARMEDEPRAEALAAFAALAGPAAGGAPALRAHELTPAFQLIRAFACEAFYSDFVAGDATGPGAWQEIDFAPPLAARLDKDWSYLGVTE
jgi:hypothetical protein